MLDIDKRFACCFSGYRPEKFLFDFHPQSAEYQLLIQSVNESLIYAISHGYHTFICGMSRGFDLLCGKCVINLQTTEYPHICLIAAIPYEGFSDNWNALWRDRYDNIYDNACERIYTSTRYTPGCYHKRNRFMVNHSSLLICYWDGNKGGTAYTHGYALQKNLQIYNLASIS